MKTDSKYVIDLKRSSSKDEPQKFVLEDDFFDSCDNTFFDRGSVEAEVSIACRAGIYTVTISLTGSVEVPCALCLEPVSVPVAYSDDLIVRFVGDTMLVDDEPYDSFEAKDGLMALDDFFREFIIVSLPIVSQHPEGQCDSRMAELIASHQVTTFDEALVSDVCEEDDLQIDSRWSALKNWKSETED